MTVTPLTVAMRGTRTDVVPVTWYGVPNPPGARVVLRTEPSVQVNVLSLPGDGSALTGPAASAVTQEASVIPATSRRMPDLPDPDGPLLPADLATTRVLGGPRRTDAPTAFRGRNRPRAREAGKAPCGAGPNVLPRSGA